MGRENLPSMLEDRQAVRLEDYIEDDLTRIYVYEQVTVKNEFITLYTQGVTFIVMGRATAIPTIDSNGNHYFEALAEVTQSGELQAVNKNELGNTKFVNTKTAKVLTNGFKNKLMDTPKLYTIGKPFDYDEYMKGNQGVYVATITPTGMFSKQDLVDEKIIDAANLLEDIELTQMTLNNLLAIEKSVAASRLVILPYAGNLEDPRVDVKIGKYTLGLWWEETTENNLFRGFKMQYLNKVLLPGDTEHRYYINYGSMEHAYAFKNKSDEASPDFGSENEMQAFFNRIFDGTIEMQEVTATGRADLHMSMGEHFVKMLARLGRLQVQTTNDFGRPYKDIGTTLPIHLATSSGTIPTRHPALIDDTITELRFLFGTDKAYTTAIQWMKCNNYDLVDYPNSGPVTDTSTAVSLVPIGPQFFATNVAFASRQYKYTLKNQPGFKVRLSSQALMSALNVTALQNNIRQDLQMNTDIDFVPMMIRVIDDRDRVELQLPWFETSVTAPIYKVKPFMKNEGATLGALFTVGSEDERKVDLTCLWDMITITKLVRDKFKTIPVEANNEIGHLNVFCSSTTNFSTQAFKGGTAAQLNDSIYEAWRLDNNLSHDDDRVKQMRQIIALLSLYIASPDAIAGGTNRFNQVCQPYYLQGLEGLLTVDIGTPTSDGKGQGSRWVVKPVDVPAHDKTAATVKDIDKWKLILKSEYFNINNGEILAKTVSDLTKTVFKTGDAKIELPVLPTTVSKQNALTKASDFEQKSTDGVSHIVYLPITSLEAFKLLYLERESTQVNKKVPQTFNITLPDVFHHELSQEELDKKLEDYMWQRYSVKPKSVDQVNGYTVTRPFSKSVIAQERVFSQMTDQGKRGWPKWLEDGCENFYDNTLPIMGDTVGGSLKQRGFSVAERIAISAHQSGNKNLYYTHHDHPDEWYLPYIVKNYYGEYKDVALTDIKILNYESSAQAGNLEIFYNKNYFEGDERWWHLKFSFTVPVVKYADAIVEFQGQFSDYSDNVRGSVFTKSEFYEFLATLNMSNDAFYEEPVHELTFWTNNKIDYIEAVDLTALFVDELSIVINDYVIPVPALNRETPTITYQKIILP